MTTRKTRQELDAEMQTVDLEPTQGSQVKEHPSAEHEPLQGSLLPSPDTNSVPSGDDQTKQDELKLPFQASRWLLGIIESLLFAAGDLVSIQSLLEVLSDLQSDLTPQTLRQAVEQLRVELREQGRGIRVVEVAGEFQLRTSTESTRYVRKLLSRKPSRLTRATLETLAIVAYRQPVTRGEVEDIRGVDCGAVLKHLLEKKMIKIIGRKEEPGRPLLYGTTKEFLSHFSLKGLASLPTLKDFAELSDEHQASLGLHATQDLEKDSEPSIDRHTFRTEHTDAYSPVGDDEVVQELAEALAEVKKHDRQLRKTFLQPEESELQQSQPSDHPQTAPENRKEHSEPESSTSDSSDQEANSE